MSYIPLIEHARPRVLMLDFALHDVAKLKKAGFDTYRGATGLYDNQEFHFPLAKQDVEVLFAQVQTGSFTSEERTASKNSVEEKPFFKDLMRETWQRAGWVVLFISQNTSPEELDAIGLESVGVISREGKHAPESLRGFFLKVLEEQVRRGDPRAKLPPLPQMPRFRGQAVRTSKAPEAAILERYIRSAQMSVLTCFGPEGHYQRLDENAQPHVVTFGLVSSIQWLIEDNSADENIMALKIDKSVYIGQQGGQPIYKDGGILLLPDFGDNNGNIALALLQEVFTQVSPHLFDTPQHPWLEKYQPASVLRLQAERASIIEAATQKVRQLDEQTDREREKYSWLLGLLVSTGDQFEKDVAQALRFLGFEVEEVDNTLAPGQRRREDYRIWDQATGYFALGEAKTTGKGRGAAEDFITKTQTHQARYARENLQVPPSALLIVNYATDLDPKQRAGRFYQIEVAGRLEDNAITALNSVALFELCQFVLNEQLSKEQIRQFIARGQPLINSVTPEEVVA